MQKMALTRVIIIVASPFYCIRGAFRICGFAFGIREIASGMDQITSGNCEIRSRNLAVNDGVIVNYFQDLRSPVRAFASIV